MNETTALAVLTEQKVDLILKGFDTTGMTPEEKQELALALYDSFMENADGFDYRPQKIIINKESQNFTTPTGETVKEIRSVVLFTKKTRAYYAPDQDDDDKVPMCSSQDCITGRERDEVDDDGTITRAGKTKLCSSCKQDEWRTAVDEKGNPAKGKACKECRKTYHMLPGYEFPATLTVAPTSIRVWDDYCSGLATAGKSLLAKETILSLSKKGEGKKTYAVLNPPTPGNAVPVKDIKKYYDLLKKFVAIWKAEAVTREDLAQAGDVDAEGVDDLPGADQNFTGTTIDASGDQSAHAGGDPGKAW